MALGFLNQVQEGHGGGTFADGVALDDFVGAGIQGGKGGSAHNQIFNLQRPVSIGESKMGGGGMDDAIFFQMIVLQDTFGGGFQALMFQDQSV